MDQTIYWSEFNPYLDKKRNQRLQDVIQKHNSKIQYIEASPEQNLESLIEKCTVIRLGGPPSLEAMGHIEQVPILQLSLDTLDSFRCRPERQWQPS